MGAIPRRGPAQTIFWHGLKYPLRTSNAKFKTIPVNNVAKIIKIPNIGGYGIWGLYEDVDLHGPFSVFCCSIYYELQIPNLERFR